MPTVKKLTKDDIQEVGKKVVRNNKTTLAILKSSEAPKKRGRPAGSKNKPKAKAVIKGMELDKTYDYYFVADACGCRIGVNVIGSGMWCEHKNSMHLEGRSKYNEVKYTGE